MSKNVRNLLALMLAVITVFGVVSPGIFEAGAADVANVGTLWDGYTAGTGTFAVTESSRLFVISEEEPTGDLLQTAQLLQRQLQDEFEDESAFTKLVYGDESLTQTGDVVLVLDASSGTGADGYKLDVNATTATVTAADTDGLIYGTNNLMKCFRAVGGNSISGFSGNDTPDTRERTVHLDLARKYYTPEWVKNFIRQMSWMGYNALELHLSEDGGFRADFWDSNYYTANYQPKNDFTWLCGSHVQSWVKDPYRTDPNAGDYLTTAELVDICNVAAEYHIEIIPSFDSPAHMDYITWKFEQNYKSNNSYSFTYNGTTYKASSTSGCINYTGKTGASSPTWPYYTTIDITDGTMAKAFVFALYEDMADFFKEYAGSTKFNIGADEVNLTDCTPKWSYSQFPGYVNELNRMLNAKGYTVRMYNDFIGSTTYNQEYDTSEGISSYNSKYDFDDNIEICYWTSDFHPTTGEWSEPVWHVKFFWETNTGTTDNWGDGGRTMYNCIQTNTYYVLREGTSGTHRDARDPENRNWTFYHTNAEAIFNEWYPADISEKGVCAENAADVPADQLGGAYFLIWNDYAALNTEEEVWNGAPDCYTSGQIYYLFDIMAANSIKMWNSDINKSTVTYTYKQSGNVNSATYNGTVTYDEFNAVNSKFGWFPGFEHCSSAANLPEAVEPESAVDKTLLIEALDAVITEQGNYTDSSWSAYLAAVDTARLVCDDPYATQEQVDGALDSLNSAMAALVERADKTALQSAIDEARNVTNDNYTTETWDAFQSALEAAVEVNVQEDATQAEVDEALKNLQTAESNLLKNPGSVTDPSDPPVTGEESEDITVRKISASTPMGKKVGLVIVAPEDAAQGALTVTLNGVAVELDLCVTNIQTLDGELVRVWMVNFPANKTGTFTYKITVKDYGYKTTSVTIN